MPVVNNRYAKHLSMNKTPSQAKSGHIVLQAIKNFIGKLRQNPDVYPIRYYKKTRRYGSNFDRQAVK
jgi:hypothetical protein